MTNVKNVEQEIIVHMI